MKSKLRIALMLIMTMALLVVVLAGCTDEGTNNGTQNGSSELSFSMVYKAAQDLGYTGTLEELIEAFKGDSAYQIAVANGYTGSEAEWLLSLKGATGATGATGADGKTPFIGENGNWWIGEIDCGVTATGKDGNGILRIEHSTNSENPEILNVTVYFTNETTTSFSIKNGEKGENGAKGDSGNGISKIEKTDTEGLTDTYTITFTDGTTTEFTVINGATGATGATGNGIDRIEKTASDGNEDTYTIYYTNGDTFEFTLTNGNDGQDGATGATGATGNGIESIEKTDTDGNKDIYTITFTDGTTTEFTVINGATGATGATGNGIDRIEKTGTNGKVDTYTIYYTNGDTFEFTLTNGTDGTDGATGANGNGIESIEKTDTDGNKDIYTITFTDGNTTTFTVTNASIQEDVTVIFDAVDGVIPDTYTALALEDLGNGKYKVVLPANTPITALPIPEKTEYDFLGWFTGETVNDGQWFNYFDIKADMTLYARWQHKYLKFALNDDGESYSVIGLETTAYTDIVISSVYEGKPVTSIGNSAFSGCRSLTSVVIPDSVTSIGDGAFLSCVGLTSFTIGNGVISIGSYAFKFCAGLTSVTIPDSVTSIGDVAFMECRSLMCVNYSGTVSEWESISKVSSWDISAGDYTVYCADGEVAKDGKVIYYHVGSQPTSGLEYTLNAGGESFSVTGIGTATDNDIVIASTYNDKPVTSIGNSAFNGCSSITSVVIPDSVTSIGSSAFRGCSSLTSVKIGNSVTSIGSGAFYGCNNLKVVDITNLARWCGMSYGGLETNPLYIAHNLYLNGELVTDLVIPEGVTSINNMAFDNCRSLASVVIPDSVTSIGEWAFSGCNGLTSVDIPDSVTSIGSNAFRGCVKLVEVYNKSSLNIIKGNSDFGYIGYYAKEIYTQEHESKLSTDENGFIIYTDGESKILMGYKGKEAELTLPEGITEIYKEAFYNCLSLKSLVISDEVTSIGQGAFDGGSDLKYVYYKGTSTDWAEIYIGSSNSNLTNATRYYYSETEPTLTDDGTDYNGNYWHYDNGEIAIWRQEKD